MSLFNGRYQSPRKSDGTVNSGGKLYFYETGTSTLKTVYQDENLAASHTNPIILDSNGSALVFLGNGSYDYQVDDSDDAAVVPLQGPITANADINNITVSPNLVVNGDFTGFDSSTNLPDSWNIMQGNAVIIDAGPAWSGETALEMTADTGETSEIQSTVVTISQYREYLFLIECETSGGSFNFSVGLSESSDSNVWDLDSLDLNNRVYARTFNTGVAEIANGRIWITLSSTSGLATATIGSIKMIDITAQSRIPSYSNLLLTNNSVNPNTQIDITADSVDLLANNQYPVKFRNVNVTGDITTDLFSGTEAVSTWYKVYLTYHLGTISVRFVVDSSSLASDNAIYSRLVGYVYNDASGNFQGFVQRNRAYRFQEVITNLASSQIGGTWTLVTFTVPASENNVYAHFEVLGNGAGTNGFLSYRTNGATHGGIAVGGGRTNSQSYTQFLVEVDSGRNIQVRFSVGSFHLAEVSTSGFDIEAL